MLEAWVLVISLGLPSATAISGIGSQAACQALMQQIAADKRWVLGGMACYSYQAAAPGLAIGQPVAGAIPNTAFSADANSNLSQSNLLTST